MEIIGFYGNNWRLLKTQITNILNNEYVHTSFEASYQHAYTIVLHNQGEKLYHDLEEFFKRHLIEKVRPSIINASDSLNKLIEARKEFYDSLRLVRDTLCYFERIFINQRRRHFLHIISLGKHLFNTEIILNSNVCDRMKTVLSEMIESSRKSENWEELKSACKILLELGDGNRKIYEECFEKVFLEKSAEFYKSESQKYLKNGCEFVTKIREILSMEENFFHFLDPKTLSKLNMVLTHELITSNIQSILNMEHGGIVYMLENNCTEELNILHSLIDRIPNGLNFDVSSIIKYIRVRYSKILDKLNEILVSNNFIDYVESLLDLKNETDIFMKKFFNNKNQLCVKVQENVCHLLKPDPQIFSLYIDHFLKRNSLENGIFEVIGKATDIFKLLAEKDVFEKFYKKHLAKRLLFGKTSSYENEKHFISKLKDECGISFTQKIEAMLKDIEIINDLMTSYKNKNAGKNDIYLNVQVLTKSYWPISDIHSCILPISAEMAFNKFKDFYFSKHSGRILL